MSERIGLCVCFIAFYISRQAREHTHKQNTKLKHEIKDGTGFVTAYIFHTFENTFKINILIDQSPYQFFKKAIEVCKTSSTPLIQH